MPGALQMRRFTVVVPALATLFATSPLLAQQTAQVTADLPATMSRFLDVLDRHRLGVATRAFSPVQETGDIRGPYTCRMGVTALNAGFSLPRKRPHSLTTTRGKRLTRCWSRSESIKKARRSGSCSIRSCNVQENGGRSAERGSYRPVPLHPQPRTYNGAEKESDGLSTHSRTSGSKVSCHRGSTAKALEIAPIGLRFWGERQIIQGCSTAVRSHADD
jgi:hypothetical protein